MNAVAAVHGQRAPMSPTRCVTAVVLVGLAVSIVAGQATYRGGEAWLAAGFARHLISGPTQVIANTATFFVHAGQTGMFGLRITAECSSWPFAVGFTVISAVLMAGSRLGIGRILLAAFAAIGVFVLVNQLRIQVVALASDHWGLDRGYQWSHVWVGTAITIVGAIVAFAAYLVVLGRGPSILSRSQKEIDR